MATAIPSPVLVQIMPQAGQQTRAIKFSDGVVLATVSIRALNTSSVQGNFTFWIVPAGQETPTAVNEEQHELPLEAKGSSVDFGYSLKAGDAIFVQGSVAGMKFTINGLQHQS